LCLFHLSYPWLLSLKSLFFYLFNCISHLIGQPFHYNALVFFLFPTKFRLISPMSSFQLYISVQVHVYTYSFYEASRMTHQNLSLSSKLNYSMHLFQGDEFVLIRVNLQLVYLALRACFVMFLLKYFSCIHHSIW
jgi:hypothetical protein